MLCGCGVESENRRNHDDDEDGKILMMWVIKEQRT